MLKKYTAKDGFYEQILKRLRCDVPGLHFDLYFGQDVPELDENDNPRELPFNVPAAFFEIQKDEVVTLGNRRKQIALTFGLHLVNEVVAEADNTSNEAIRGNAHKHLQVVDQVKASLDGWSGSQVSDGFNQFGTIEWVDILNYEANGMYIKHVPIFKVRLIDDCTRTVYQKLTGISDEVISQIIP